MANFLYNFTKKEIVPIRGSMKLFRKKTSLNRDSNEYSKIYNKDVIFSNINNEIKENNEELNESSYSINAAYLVKPERDNGFSKNTEKNINNYYNDNIHNFVETENITNNREKKFEMELDNTINGSLSRNIRSSNDDNLRLGKISQRNSDNTANLIQTISYRSNFNKDNNSKMPLKRQKTQLRKSIINNNGTLSRLNQNYSRKCFNTKKSFSRHCFIENNNYNSIRNNYNNDNLDTKLEVSNLNQKNIKENYNDNDNNNYIHNLKIKNNNNIEISSKISSDNLIKNFKRKNNNIVKLKNKDKIYDKKSLYNNYNNNFCDICLSSFSLQNNQEEIITLECGHFYCKDCIKRFIITTVSKYNFKNNIESTKCPKPVCSKLISNEKIVYILKDDEINMAKYKKNKKIIEMLVDKQYSIPCPIRDCDSFAYKNSLDKGKYLCENGHNFCMKCQEIHSTKNDKCRPLTETELSTDIFFKKSFDIKKCPQCSTYQHKSTDCNTNAVKCGYELCNHEFCWLCLKESEKTHYTNPLSSCYRLGEIDTKHVLATSNSLRMTKYFLIILLLMLIIPFIIIFSSIIFITFFILAFVPDGSAVKHIKMKKKRLEPIFKMCVSGIYFFIAVSLIPCGYIIEASLILLSPIIILCYKKFSSWKMEYF
jgi:hypothetical protein